MPLSDLTFRLGDTGFVLNADSLMPFVDINKVNGFDSAPFRITTKDHEGVDGGFVDAEFEKGREIGLEGTVVADVATIEAFLDDLKAAYAPSRTVQPFYVKAPGVVERVMFVKSLGVKYDWTTDRRYGSIPVRFELYAEDPRFYDSNLQSIPFSQGATTFVGVGFSIGFPFGFGGVSSTSDGQNIFNSGNRDAPGIMTITGPVTNPLIVNDTVGLTMKFNIVLAVDETLVIDLANRTVKLNGLVNRRGTMTDPNWFLFPPGNTFLRYRADSAPPSTMTLQFRPAWR